ncbi:MAG: tetratricopeptide (TPR) repeat protein, partial [Neolewinella sp.]
MSKPLFLLLLLFSVTGLSAQSAPQKSTLGKQRQPVTIEAAERLRKEDPTEAIRMLNDLIQQSATPGDLTRVFILLGDIYVDIGQEDLALGRYDRAKEVLLGNDRVAAATLEYKRGRVFLRQERYAEAKASFTGCLNMAPEGTAQSAACREGLADVEARLNNYTISQDYYGQVKEEQPDSLTQMRVNAKQANVYLQQNDIVNSTNSLNQAIQQVPRNQRVPEQDAADLIAANTNVRAAVVRNAPDLDVAVVDVLPSAPAELIMSDEFARFQALRDIGQLRKAEISLKTTLESVNENTSPEVATEVYAEGATFYLENSQPELAADMFRDYTIANDQLLADRRAEIDEQVAILQGQQSVDLGLKDLRAAAVEDDLRERQMNLQIWLNYLLGALLLGALLSVFVILRNVKKRRRTNQELMLRNMQTRMNPHFIFNSLNSINNYIARQDERSANRYLGRFAKLMRRVLDQSGKDFVPLSEELEQLELYLELEKERFGGKFDYTLTIDEKLSEAPENLDLPPMILQPFVENAIWHGLRYREAGGELEIIVEEVKGRPVVVIRDNGIGRQKSAKLKTENQRRHKSAGVETSRQRLELVNEHYGRNYGLKI